MITRSSSPSFPPPLPLAHQVALASPCPIPLVPGRVCTEKRQGQTGNSPPLPQVILDRAPLIPRSYQHPLSFPPHWGLSCANHPPCPAFQPSHIALSAIFPPPPHTFSPHHQWCALLFPPHTAGTHTLSLALGVALPPSLLSLGGRLTPLT